MTTISYQRAPGIVGTYRGGEPQVIKNDMAASLLHEVTWRKSRYSNPCGSCVEMAHLADGRIAVRNSRHPDGPALIYPRAGMAAFIHRTKRGDFDGASCGSMA